MLLEMDFRFHGEGEILLLIAGNQSLLEGEEENIRATVT